MAGEGESEEEKKEVCIQVKLGKEEKVKPSVDRAGEPGCSTAWDPIRATRPNQVCCAACTAIVFTLPGQDYQRETEDSCVWDIQASNLATGHVIHVQQSIETKTRNSL